MKTKPNSRKTGAKARNDAVAAMIARGVEVRCPESVEIAPDVRPERIAPGVVLHAGTRLRGAETSIGPDCEIGAEAPATVENCRLGRGVALKGGFFSGATFLDGANMGSAAHVRPGTLLEEEANAAHAVGFKQTILLPFVTAGSLINFCDVLMAGGADRKNHSEIGSSYVHFNFTPYQDKATPSLLGDVPRGVLLDRPPIFLGGQGGMVGPCRVEYGVVIAAGCLLRKDALEPNTLVAPPALGAMTKPFPPGGARALGRVLRNNFIFLGNLHALREWYLRVRAPFMERDPWSAACLRGALEILEEAIAERARRLKELAGRVVAGDAAAVRWKEHGVERAERAATAAAESVGAPARDRFLAAWAKADRAGGYIAAVRALTAEQRRAATEWLQAIVEATARIWTEN